MLAMRMQWINKFIAQLRYVLPSQFTIDAWTLEPDAKFWRCEIRADLDLYWLELKIEKISEPHDMRVLVECIKNQMP